jgi:hypothetical protein
VFDSGERYAKADAAVKAARSSLLFRPTGRYLARRGRDASRPCNVVEFEVPNFYIACMKNEVEMRVFFFAVPASHREVEREPFRTALRPEPTTAPRLQQRLQKKFAD